MTGYLFGPEKLHVVIGADGEYSSREEWVAGVFTDLEVAQERIIVETAHGRERALERFRWLEKQKELLEAARKKKITPEMLSYYGESWVPRMALTDDEMHAIAEEMGPLPRAVDYNNYYIVTVPLNEWGVWNEYSEECKDAASG